MKTGWHTRCKSALSKLEKAIFCLKKLSHYKDHTKQYEIRWMNLDNCL